MKLTVVPLPRIRDLLGAIFCGTESDIDICKPWCQEDDAPFLFSKSAWALKTIILWWEKFFNKTAPVIWLPDYFCNQALTLVRQTDAKIIFYPVDRQGMPKWDSCHTMAVEQAPDLFVLVHYFGIPADVLTANRFCKQYNSILIEDAVHVLAPIKGIGSLGHFVLYSPHKLLALPHGAVCIMRPKFSKDNGQAKLVMSAIQNSLARKSPAIGKWLAKRLVQKIMPFSYFQAKPFTVDGDKDAEVDEFPQVANLVKKLLARQAKHLTQISQYRQNHNLLWRELLGKNSVNLLNEFADKDNDIIPYMAVFRGKNTANIGDDYAKILASKWPVQTWPDLPLEVRLNPEQHSDAIYLRNNILTLPVHHTLNLGKYFYDYFRKVKLNLQDYSFRLYPTKKEWQNLFVKVPQSNLLQSWAYGETKKCAENWQVDRYIFLKNDKPIALLQILVKKYFGIKILRINRGPLWLNSDVLEIDKIAIFRLIKKISGLLSSVILLIAPELCNTIKDQILLKALNFHKRKQPEWRSIWLDLAQTEETLRGKLDSKWRNQLKKAESCSMNLKISVGEEDVFAWLLEQYQQLQQQKNFQGIPSTIIKELWRHSRTDKSILIFQALVESKPVAAILVYVHGNSATYLLGWNSEVGRKNYANNFLLWQAIVDLKRQGRAWFDLGGIDTDNTASIAKFKQGLGGIAYQLIGEYWG